MKLTNLTLTTPYLSLDPIFYHQVTPTPLKNPRLISHNPPAAEKNDFTLVNDLLALAQNPYDEHERFERYAQPTPHAFKNLKLSCSS